jgi:DNA-binding GntR family transcriptional regulator
MVYSILREAIMSGTLAPGEFLRQESLADAIGVSRIPVRTALLQLKSDGLVNFRPHRGAQVRALSAAQIDEVYRLRILLQSYALQRSMAKMTPDRIEILRKLAVELDHHPESGQFVDTRIQFYRELHDAESNPMLVEMIEDLSGQVGRYLLSFRVDQHNLSSHRDLVNLVAAGDQSAAESWIRTHVARVCAGVQELAHEEEGTQSGYSHRPPR